MSRISLIGAGAWGTTLAILLAENQHQVTLYVYEADLAKEMIERRENRRFLPGFPLSEKIEITNDLKALPVSDLYIFIVPTQHLRSQAKGFAKHLPGSSIIVSASKGIEDKSLKLPLEILAEEIGCNNFCAISGPNLSSEIAKGLPAATVAASSSLETAKKVQQILMLDRFRVYTNTDVVGVQLGGALKNVIAIAAGLIDGLGLGNNAKAGLMIRGLAEISRLGVAMGGKAETLAGLSGMGDLITTCSSKLSRNHFVGEELARGEKLANITKNMTAVAEGVPTCEAAIELGKRYQIEMPITQEVYNVLHHSKDPYQAISDLMTRHAKSE